MSTGNYDEQSPVAVTLNIIGAKWKIMILVLLMKGTMRFSELQRNLPGITQKMLAMRLREMEHDQLVKRKVYAVVPPKVEYSLTEFGQSLEPVIKRLSKWGEEFLETKNQK